MNQKKKKKNHKAAEEREWVPVCRGVTSNSSRECVSVCVFPKNPPEFVSPYTHGHRQTHTHTRTSNPPLLVTNERIITFADMWRGV